jgi:hypothetical protein
MKQGEISIPFLLSGHSPGLYRKEICQNILGGKYHGSSVPKFITIDGWNYRKNPTPDKTYQLLSRFHEVL